MLIVNSINRQLCPLQETAGLAELPTTVLWCSEGREAGNCFSTINNVTAVAADKEDDEMKKSIGVPVNPPERECTDHRCAWHGSLPVRGTTFQGTVRSSKARNTVVVEWGYTHLVQKYERYERRKSRVVAYNPECMKAREGDQVVIAECRPLSKTKSFVVVAVPKRKVDHAEFKVAEIEEKAVEKARKSGAESTLRGARKPLPKGVQRRSDHDKR